MRRFTWACFAVGLALCCMARGGEVELRDGRKMTGDVNLEGGKIVVVDTAGVRKSFELGEIVRAKFRDEPAPETKPAALEKPKKPEPVQGLRGEYFGDLDLKELRLMRIDPKVNFWWSGPPDASIPKRFSARWTGRIRPAYSERYKLSINVCGTGRLWIDNRLVIDHSQGPPGRYDGEIDLQSDRLYDLKMEYSAHTQGGYAHLLWSSRSQREQNVPAERLYPPEGTKVPLAKIISPESGATIAAAEAIPLLADAAVEGGSIRRVEFFEDDALIGSADRAPWRMEWRNARLGSHHLVARATDQTGLSATSEPIGVAVVGNGSGTLPTGWMEMPVGTLDRIGAVSQSGGSFLLMGQNSQLWDEPQTFHFTFRPLAGDGSIVARVRTMNLPEGGGGGVGVMLRGSVTSGHTAQAMLVLDGNGNLSFASRANRWGNIASSDERGAAPCWLKLTRSGPNVAAYRSEDGVKWRPVGQKRLEMPAEVYAGLNVASEAGGNAQMDQVSVTTETAVYARRGVVLRSGSFIAGNVEMIDGASVRLRRDRQRVLIPTGEVSLLVFRPVLREMLERIPKERSGALMSNGDFFDGALSMDDGWRISVANVLLGARLLNTLNGDVAAGALREVGSDGCAYVVKTVDGSVVRAKSVTVAGDLAKVAEVKWGAFEFAAGEVAEIRRGADSAGERSK